MKKRTRKGSLLAGWLFLFSGVMFTLAAVVSYRNHPATFDKVLSILPVVAMLLASAVNFVAASRIRPATEQVSLDGH